jgi:hypothetical protein
MVKLVTMIRRRPTVKTLLYSAILSNELINELHVMKANTFMYFIFVFRFSELITFL